MSFFQNVTVDKDASTMTIGGAVLFRDTFEPLSAAGKEISMCILTLATARTSLKPHPRSNGFLRMCRVSGRNAWRRSREVQWLTRHDSGLASQRQNSDRRGRLGDSVQDSEPRTFLGHSWCRILIWHYYFSDVRSLQLYLPIRGERRHDISVQPKHKCLEVLQIF